MKIILPLVVGLLFASGTYLILKRNVLKLVLGFSLLGHASNVLLITSGWVGAGKTPILGENGTGPYVDPIPQALILTAIVIGFAASAFLLVLALRAYQDFKTADIKEIRGQRG